MNRLYARHRLDIGPRHLATAFVSLFARDQPAAAAAVEQLWSAHDSALACYSVRSGFHLLLTALDLQRGSEVLFSAITHPDMARIAGHHGLVAVPVDLDPETLAPRLEILENAISSRSRVLVIAHLFGGHVDLGPLSRLCLRHGIVIVEDCAQSFQGLPGTGDGHALVSMFSFGMLKTATALGGAMLTVRDPRLLGRMRAIQSTWRLQKRSGHLERIVQTAVFVALTRPAAYAAMARLTRAMAIDFDRLVNTSARAFPAAPTPELIWRLEQRPGAPLLELLRHRLETFDAARLLARAATGERLAAILPPGLHIGEYALDHSHWLFPVVLDHPDTLIDAARAAGFDAARSASSVNAVPAPATRPDLDPGCAREVMARLVFLPAYPELGDGGLDTLGAVFDREEAHAYVSR